jgi:hypothetical protein
MLIGHAAGSPRFRRRGSAENEDMTENRPGVFRLNVAVGRTRFKAVVGWPPAEHAARSGSVDYAVLDEVVRQPVYAAQGWVSILSPGERSAEQVRALVAHAHARAVRAWRPRSAG